MDYLMAHVLSPIGEDRAITRYFALIFLNAGNSNGMSNLPT